MSSSDALLQLLTVLVQELKSSLSTRMDQIINKIEKIEESRLHTENYIQKLAADLQKQQQELTALKNYCQQSPKNTQTTPTTTAPVGLQQSPSERGIRRNNLIITGIDIGQQDPNIFISNFLTAHFAIKQDALLAIQKLSTRSTGDTNSDNINTKGEKFLITLKSVWDAQIIYNQRLQKLKNLDIYISEDLTPMQASLFYKARQLKKSKIINTTWTKDGRVFAKRGVGQEPFEITDDHPLLKDLATPLISPQQGGSNFTTHGLSDAQINQPISSAATTSSPSDITNETAKLTTQDSIGSLSNFISEGTQESEEEDIKQMMEEALQGALTRATRRKKKKNTKEMKEEATKAPK